MYLKWRGAGVWLNGPDSKSGVPLFWDRGFESHPLRFGNDKIMKGVEGAYDLSFAYYLSFSLDSL